MDKLKEVDELATLIAIETSGKEKVNSYSIADLVIRLGYTRHPEKKELDEKEVHKELRCSLSSLGVLMKFWCWIGLHHWYYGRFSTGKRSEWTGDLIGRYEKHCLECGKVVII